MSCSTKAHLVWPFPEASDAEEAELPRAANPKRVQFCHCVQITELLWGVIQAGIAPSPFRSPSGKPCLRPPHSGLAEGAESASVRLQTLSDRSGETDWSWMVPLWS